jgi:putative flippase GtrA
MKNPGDFSQLLRYGIVGGVANLFGYAAYLLATGLGGTPKATMTLLYAFVVLIGFFANRRFTFNHNGHIGMAGIRYLFAQLLGYLLNLTLLVLFADWLGFAHQFVQAIAIVVVAVFMFALSRLFVFAPQELENKPIRP